MRISVERYLKMAEMGVLTHEDRVELIEGEILNMPPLGTRHSAVTGKLVKRLILEIGDSAVLLPGPTLPLGTFSAPQPDLVLLKPRDDFYSDRRPLPTDVLLLVEIADTSLGFDQGVKRAVYARAGIAEYWVIDVASSRLFQYRIPRGDHYADTAEFGAGDLVVRPCLPTVEIPVGALFD